MVRAEPLNGHVKYLKKMKEKKSKTLENELHRAIGNLVTALADISALATDPEYKEHIEDYDKFKDELQHLKYAGRLATQDPQPADPQPKSPDSSSDQPVDQSEDKTEPEKAAIAVDAP